MAFDVDRSLFRIDFSNDLNLETYALAWSTRAIPEPSAALQLILACSAAAMIKTRR